MKLQIKEKLGLAKITQTIFFVDSLYNGKYIFKVPYIR